MIIHVIFQTRTIANIADTTKTQVSYVFGQLIPEVCGRIKL
jgi:hypothetical protein